MADRTIKETIKEDEFGYALNRRSREGILTSKDLLNLKTFREYNVVKDFEAIGAEADTYLIRKDNQEFFLKLYRKGVKVNEDILSLIFDLSKEYDYFNKIIEYGYDESLQRYYEISEYLKKGYIKKLDEKSAKAFISQLNEALYILHKHNIIHRDLKPTNILIKNENPLEITLIDFGISSLLDKEFSQKLTSVKGTYAYFSPEAISGYIGRKSDYFSFGMVLLSLLDKNPFDSLDNAVILNTLVTKNVPIPSNINDNYQALLKGLLTREPEKRWGYQEVKDWLSGKISVIYYDEKENSTEKYKFQGNSYNLQELAIAFLQEENFEIAQKHIARGYITKYLENLGEFDLAIAIDEQENLLDKLYSFVYSIHKNLEPILYGKIIDKEYIFSLLLKKLSNTLSNTEERIYNIIMDIKDKKFLDTLILYESLTNKKTGLIEFIKKIYRELFLEWFLDIENIILSQDDELIEIALKFLNVSKIENIYKIIKASLETNNKELIQRFYNDSITQELFNIAIKDKDINTIEFLLQKGEKPKKEIIELFRLLYSSNVLDKYLHLFDYDELKMMLKYIQIKIKNINLIHNSNYVNSIAISYDDKYIVSGHNGNIIKIWDFKTGKLLKTLGGGDGRITSIAISNNNKYIISARNYNTIRIWEFKTGKLLKVLTGHTYFIESIAISHNNKYIISGSYDETIRIWEFKTGKLLKTLTGHTSLILSIAISYNDRYIVSGSYDRTIKIWDLKTGELLKTLKGHKNSIQSIAISHDDRYIVSGSWDETIKIWDLKTGELLKTLTGHTDDINSIAISHDDKYIVSGSDDKTIRVWDLKTGELLKTLTGHTDDINSIAISHG